MKWIMGLIIPIVITIVAILILIFKPKRNSWLGYRTQRSLSDDNIWHYSNKVMAISMIALNILICIPAVCLINIFVKNTLAVILIDTFMPIIMLVAVIVITEICIRHKFNGRTP